MNGHAAGPTPSHSAILRRRDDLLWLRFDFHNLRLDGSSGTLVRQNPNQSCRVVVWLPPQSLLEEAVPHQQNASGQDQTPVPAAGSLQARLAGPTRLGFTIPEALLPLPYTTEALLNWAAWTHMVPLGARRAAKDPPEITEKLKPYGPMPPEPLETAIEAPWWLLISPNRASNWTHRIAPGAKPLPSHVQDALDQSRIELWHTRLTSRPTLPVTLLPDGAPMLGSPTENPTNNRVIRAVWSPAPDFPALIDGSKLPTQLGIGPFVSAMTPKQRLELVRVTTDYTLMTQFQYEPQPVTVDRLDLSALGASLSLDGHWADAPGIDIISWRHRSTYGRDHYVRIVDRGYLTPFGHRCVQITITERRFMGSGASRVAPLVNRKFLVAVQPRLDYAGADGARQINAGRSLPFRSVRLRTIVTPPITVDGLAGSGVAPELCYYPLLTGSNADLRWHVVATDWAGVAHDLVMPMAWVASSVAENQTTMPKVREAWNQLQDDEHPERGWAPLASRRVAYAEALTGQPGSTANQTERMRLKLDGVIGESGIGIGDQVRLFFPALAHAEVRLAGVEALTANAMETLEVVYHPTYETAGFSAAQNAGGVYMTIASPPTLRFSRDPADADKPGQGADKSGGLITPDVVLSGLSRSLGLAAGDVETIRTGNFDAAKFFEGTAPRLLGGISLLQVIDTVSLPANAPAPPTALQISNQHDGDVVETRIRWRPALKPDQPLNVFEPGTLRLDARLRTPVGGGKGSSLLEGELEDFKIHVPGASSKLLTIAFQRMAFTSLDGKKPDVDVLVKDVTFGGQLQWIEKLRKYLNFGGDGGPDIKVLSDRVEAGVGVALPNISLGVFSLKNISFQAAFEIPLSGEPARVRFGLSSREDPFRLIVFIIGGGGWVVLGFGVDGFEMLEIGFEGGAEIAVDFGPASGSISMMFGIVLILSNIGDTETASFEGFFEMRGELAVGFVSVAVGFEIGLKYQAKTKNGKTIKSMYGKGKLYIELPAIVPAPSFSVTIEKNFKSEPADPTFQDQMRPQPGDPNQSDDWTDYCHAFVAAA